MTITFGSISSIILFGGTKHLVHAAKFLVSKKISTTVISSARHLSVTDRFGDEDDPQTLEQVLDSLGVSYCSISNINDDVTVSELIQPNTFGISISAPWIFSADFIKKFDGRFVNFHSSNLPVDKGGGGFSWRIMMGNRSSAAVIHLMEPEIDAGDILDIETYNIPAKYDKPQDWANFALGAELKLLYRFLDVLLSSGSFQRKNQDSNRSTYWPRLNTNLHAYIDWSWAREEIISFIHAFDDPYDGAATFIHGREVRIKSVSQVDTDMAFHPFQRGIIYRKIEQGIFVATKNGGIFLGQVFSQDGTETIDNTLHLGDRFYTPTTVLDDSQRKRVFYSPNGLRY